MSLAKYYKSHNREIDRLILDALHEDKAAGDVTTNLLLGEHVQGKRTSAVLLCKEDCTLAGVEVFKRVFKLYDRHVNFKSNFKDGQRVRNKSKVLTVRTSLSAMLRCERTALNFVQRMSGIATMTSEFVKKLKYKNSAILHTRKTTPNFRIFEIAAVKIGGGDFHRQDLSSAIMIKDNHIAALGSISEVLKRLRIRSVSGRLKNRLEVEVKSFGEIDEVIANGKAVVEIVMLDNFKPENISKAVKILKHNGFKIELSGGINLANFDKIQRKGIDYYSIGALTHGNKSIDFSLEF